MSLKNPTHLENEHYDTEKQEIFFRWATFWNFGPFTFSLDPLHFRFAVFKGSGKNWTKNVGQSVNLLGFVFSPKDFISYGIREYQVFTANLNPKLNFCAWSVAVGNTNFLFRPSYHGYRMALLPGLVFVGHRVVKKKCTNFE